jgi:PAS domain S-box-containing protein
VKRPALTSAAPPLAFEQVLDALSDPVVASDESGKVLYLNAAAEGLLGWSAAEVIGKPLTTIMPARLRPAHEEGFRRFMATGRSTIVGRPVRVSALQRDGSEIDVELTLSELRPETGRLLMVAVIRDLRDRVELERKVTAQRKILAQYATVAVIADATDATTAMPQLLKAAATALDWEIGIYWEKDSASNQLRMSAAWSSGSPLVDGFVTACRSLTFAPGEGLPGMVFQSGQADWSRNVRTDPRYLRGRLALAHGLCSALAFPVYTRDRTWGVLEYLSKTEEAVDDELRQTMTVLGFQIGQFLARLEHEVDIRRALARAEAERRNLETLFENAPAAIAIVRGPELRYELSNAVNQELAGGRQLVGKTVREALPELEADGVTAVVRSVYDTGKPFVAREYAVTAPATDHRPARRMFMNGICQPLRGPNGAIEGAMIFAYDVTDMVASRQRVEEAEERLRLALESAELGTWDYDPQSGAIQCDASFRRLFGLRPDGEMNTKRLMSAIRMEDRPGVEEAARRSFDPHGGGGYVAQYRTVGIDDGVERWISVHGRTFFDEQGKPHRFVGTGVDITREKVALERERFLAEATAVLASSFDYGTTVASVGKLAVPTLADGCAVELLPEADEPPLLIVEHASSPQAERLREVWRRSSPDPTSPLKIDHVVSTGQPTFIPDVSEQPGIRSAMILPIKVRDRTIGLLGLFQAESGRRYSASDLTFAAELARRTGAAIENARLYDQAKRAVGIRDQFLSIASHELRTPLTALTFLLSTVSKMVARGTPATGPDGDKLAERISRMRDQIGRLNTLVDDLLNVSRIATGRLSLNLEPMDLVELVKDVLNRLNDVAEHANSRMTLRAPESLKGRWDHDRIDQVVTNLVGNAIKHAAGTPIDVEVGCDDNIARLVVRDQGPGIRESDQKRIFERFERAAPPALAGFGLGLWLVKSIVDAHNGRVEVASTPGNGARFVIELPIDTPT